jgi:hypothetical protein
MSQSIRERLALQDECNRRALSQRLLRAGEMREAANESDVESLRAGAMLVGAIIWSVFVLACAVLGIVAAGWWSSGVAFVASVPMECAR